MINLQIFSRVSYLSINQYIIKEVLHSPQRIRTAQSRHFRLEMNTNEYRKKSDNPSFIATNSLVMLYFHSKFNILCD